MTEGRDAFAHYRQRLQQLGFRPSSARGQNFLLDPTLHRWIAECAAPTAADLALEIGVGLGFLTRELAVRAGTVVGVEIDERLCRIAGDELAAATNVRLVQADALGGPGGSLHPRVLDAVAAAMPPTMPAGGRFLVVANLPYATSGPLLAALFCLPRLPDRIVVLVQRELGDRLAASAGTKQYGGLSAQLQTVYTVERLRTVPAEVFRPRPKVESAVVRLDRRADARLVDATARTGFQAFVRVLFGQRRKTLRTTLAQAAAATGSPPGALAGFAPDVLQLRAEALGADDLLALWRRVAPDRT